MNAGLMGLGMLAGAAVLNMSRTKTDFTKYLRAKNFNKLSDVSKKRILVADSLIADASMVLTDYATDKEIRNVGRWLVSAGYVLGGKPSDTITVGDSGTASCGDFTAEKLGANGPMDRLYRCKLNEDQL